MVSNDTWIIQGIENYPDNKVFIFNRWGDEIHYLEGYDNTRVYWDGKDKKDKVLPDGTYYYVFYIKIDGIEEGIHRMGIHARCAPIIKIDNAKNY